MTKKQQPNTAEFFNPPNTLKQKVGGGGIAEDILVRSQSFINENQIEYEPYAREYLESIKGALILAEGSRSPESQEDYIEEMTRNIMQLKASGSMFGYHAISVITDVVLNFIEKSEHRNEDLFRIIQAQNTCLTLILDKKLKGKNIKEVDILTRELYEAIRRYKKKYQN